MSETPELEQGNERRRQENPWNFTDYILWGTQKQTTKGSHFKVKVKDQHQRLSPGFYMCLLMCAGLCVCVGGVIFLSKEVAS